MREKNKSVRIEKTQQICKIMKEKTKMLLNGTAKCQNVHFFALCRKVRKYHLNYQSKTADASFFFSIKYISLPSTSRENGKGTFLLIISLKTSEA